MFDVCVCCAYFFYVCKMRMLCVTWVGVGVLCPVCFFDNMSNPMQLAGHKNPRTNVV